MTARNAVSPVFESIDLAPTTLRPRSFDGEIFDNKVHMKFCNLRESWVSCNERESNARASHLTPRRLLLGTEREHSL